MLEVWAVVFPEAKRGLLAGAEIIIVLDENPIVLSPRPENEYAAGSADVVEEETVVLPTANRLREPCDAAEVAETTNVDDDQPTETIPAPDTVREEPVVWLVVPPVTFPTAEKLEV